jgi:sugar phosphate isomerase/epimerase
MQPGIRTNPNRQLVPEIERASRLGFTFVDIDIAAPRAALETTPWGEIRAALDGHGVSATCRAAAYLPWVNPSPIVRQASLDELRRSIDVAQILGAPLLHFELVAWPEWMEEQDGCLLYHQLADILIRHGSERGVAIALSNGTDNTHMLKFMRSIFAKSPGLRFALNVGYLNIRTRRSLTREFLFALGDRVACAIYSDNDGSADQRLAFGAPASGGINLKQEVRDLKSFGFDGRVILDIGSDDDLVALSAERLRNVWASTKA